MPSPPSPTPKSLQTLAKSNVFLENLQNDHVYIARNPLSYMHALFHVSSMHVGCSRAACKPLTPYVFMGQRMYCISWSRIFFVCEISCFCFAPCAFFSFSLFSRAAAPRISIEKRKRNQILKILLALSCLRKIISVIMKGQA